MAKYTIIIEEDADGWLVSEVVGLPGCRTQARTAEELVERTKEAIQACVDEGARVSERFVGVQEIAV